MNRLKKILKSFYFTLLESIFKYGVINQRDKGVINFIDVGSIGRLPSPWYQNARAIKNILKFEPQDPAAVKKNEIVIDKVVWKENTTRPFYIYRGNDSHGASLFEQNFEYVDRNFEELKRKGPRKLSSTWHKRSTLIKTIDAECVSLDEVLEELDLSFSFDFCKIDAQGAEYEILLGASKYLKEHCIGLQLELFNIPLYKGIKLFDEVEKLMESYGFFLYKKLPFHGSFNSQNDCIFLRREVSEEKKDVLKAIKEVYN